MRDDDDRSASAILFAYVWLSEFPEARRHRSEAQWRRKLEIAEQDVLDTFECNGWPEQVETYGYLVTVRHTVAGPQIGVEHPTHAVHLAVPLRFAPSRREADLIDVELAEAAP